MGIRDRHSFSEANFAAQSHPSFESAWLRLLQAQASDENIPALGLLPSTKPIKISDLVRFLENPGRCFANQSLGLYLHDYDLDLEDNEPFNSSKLVEYKLRDQMLSAVLSDEPRACELVRQEYQLNGQLPESHLTHNIIQTSLDKAEE